MKNYSFLVALLVVGLITVPVMAQTTPTDKPTVKVPTPTGSELDDEVDKLKEKVAATVEGLKGEKEQATVGEVESVDADSLVVLQDGEKKIVTLDDTLTQYYEISGTSTKDLKKDDIEKGEYVFILGPDINGEVTANAVYRDVSYSILSGKITDVNSDDYTVSIVSLDKTNYILDIQTKTVQQMLNIKSLKVEKIGFSKLKEGDSIHVVVKTNLENKSSTRFDAVRFLIIPNEYFIQ